MWIFTICISIFPRFSSFAQDINSEGISGTLIAPTYVAQFPFGDLSDRYGFQNSIGGYLGYKFKKNWTLGIDAYLTFGQKVKDQSMLDEFVEDNGTLIGNSGFPEPYEFLHRGMNFRLSFGKVFDIIGPNPNSGLWVQFGAGYWQHKIIIDVQNGLFPYLSRDYKQGYDRLSSGFALSQFIGYIHLSDRNFFNFYVGIEIMEGFLQGRRNYQFDLMGPLNDNRFDGTIGLKFGWIIPVYKEDVTDFYTY